jgi:hypothetical protein
MVQRQLILYGLHTSNANVAPDRLEGTNTNVYPRQLGAEGSHWWRRRPEHLVEILVSSCNRLTPQSTPFVVRGKVARVIGRTWFDEAESVGMVLVSLFTEHSLVVLQQRLHSNSLLLDVGELALDVHGSHDGGSEDYGKVQGSHLLSS